MAAYYSTRITTAAIVPNLKILLHYIRQTITLMHARGELVQTAAIYSTDLQSKASNFQGKGKDQTQKSRGPVEMKDADIIEDDKVLSTTGGTFGIIHSLTDKFDISRCGPENEVHTKVIDIPAPFKTNIQIDDALEPSRYIHLAFEDIHDSHYIGINQITFKDVKGNEIPYENIEVDGQEVDGDQVKAAFPTNGWWAV
eukprot:scaffold1522_cov184-Chaetoceros_neogracile.AAC.4